jgi:hypothetical protein
MRGGHGRGRPFVNFVLVELVVVCGLRAHSDHPWWIGVAVDIDELGLSVGLWRLHMFVGCVWSIVGGGHGRNRPFVYFRLVELVVVCGLRAHSDHPWWIGVVVDIDGLGLPVGLWR